MKKIIFVAMVFVGLISYMNAEGCSKSVKIEKVQKEIRVFEILVLNKDERMLLPKCGNFTYLKGNKYQIKSYDIKMHSYEANQLKYFFSGSELRGKFLVFSSVEKLSNKRKKKLKEEYKNFVDKNEIKNFIFLDKEIRVFEILVLNKYERMLFPKCSNFTYLKGNKYQIKSYDIKMHSYEANQLKYFFSGSELRGKFLVFSSVEKLSNERKKTLIEEYKNFVDKNEIKNFIFLDED